MAADGLQSPPRLVTPPGTPAAGELPIIYVIPPEFYGVGLKRPAPKVEKVVTAVAPVAPPPKPVAPVVKKKKSRRWLWVLLLMLFLLSGGAFAVYYLYFMPLPLPVVVAPVCGDTKCEAPESTFTCSVDCGTPVPVPTPTPVPVAVCGDKQCTVDETIETCALDCTPPGPQPGVDSDNDGLTDLEETTVYGSNSRSANTDSDSYVDLNEVLNLFDPIVPAPASLSNNKGISVFTNKDLAVTLLHPKAWTVQPVDLTAKSVVFVAPSGETMTVRIFEKQADEGLTEWYARTYSSGEVGEGLDLRPNHYGHDYVMNEDRVRAWIDLSSTRVVGIRYDVVSASRVEFAVTFAMMLNSVDEVK